MAALSREVVAIYLDGLDEGDARSGEVVFEGETFPSLRTAPEHVFASCDRP